MAKSPHWRTIEFHTCEILRHWGFELDQPGDSGDKIVAKGTDYSAFDMNITEFAKELAGRLE